MKRALKIIFAIATVTIINSQASVGQAQDAVYNLIRHHYTLNADGSIDLRYRKEIKLLRNRAITAYADKGETFIIYNPAYDQLTINESYTIRKDGSRVQTPPNAFIDQLPSQCENCGRYNGIRERVVVHTALEYECTIVLDYTIHHKGLNGWKESIELTKDCPVEKFELIVDAAKDKHWETTLTNGTKSCKELSDGHAYHLVANNLEQNIIESYSAQSYPTVDIALNATNHINDTVFATPFPLPEAEDVVGELYDRDSTVWANNIQGWVADNIHTIGLDMRYVDYTVAAPRTTLLSSCGTPAEKNALLAAMLHVAGFRAESFSNGVLLTLSENNIDLDYHLTANNKTPMRLWGRAIDNQRTITLTRQLAWNGKAIGGGYEQMTIPTEEGSISIDPAKLTQERKSPLRLRNCDEQYHYTIVPPAGSRLVKPINISYSQKGIGTIAITIKQLADGNIDVVRKLNIDVENGIVTTKQYKKFRKMMQDWRTNSIITIAH